MGERDYKIAIVEPDDKWFEKISSALDKRDFYDVRRLKKAEEVIPYCRKHLPDAIIIEQDLKGMDGVELTSEIRDDKVIGKLPIIFHSEQGDKYTKIAAYEAGADLFIDKGEKKRLMLAQITAFMRRCYEMVDRPTIVQKFGEIEINEDQVMVYKNNEPIELSKKEFELLLLLTSKPGKVFKRPNILSKIWGDNIIVGDRNIDTHVKKLRKKIGKDYIKTARGIGYKFVHNSE